MKTLLATVAVAALSLPMSACADQNSETTMKKEAKQPETASKFAIDDPDKGREPVLAESGAVAYLAAEDMSVRDLLGEGIIGVDGERIARVDDIVIGADGKAESVVFLSGGLFGLGGKRAALDYDRIGLAIADDHEPRVKVSMTKEAIQAVAEYKTNEINDYRLASELVGASARLSNSDDQAVISDLILAKNGNVRYAVIQNGMVGSLGGEKRAVPYNKIVIEQGDGGVILDLTPAMLEASSRFEYRRGKSGDGNL